MTVGKQHEIARKLLAVLYNDWAHHQGISLNSLRNEEQWDKNDFDSVIGRLKDLGVIENGTSNSFRLTPDGVLHAEDNAFVPETEVKRHRELRTKALAFLADLYQKELQIVDGGVIMAQIMRTLSERFCLSRNQRGLSQGRS